MIEGRNEEDKLRLKLETFETGNFRLTGYDYVEDKTPVKVVFFGRWGFV